MENNTLVPSAIQWTRKFVVTLSIIIIITSLSQYSKEAASIVTLLPNNKGAITDDDNEDLVNRLHSFGQALIQDRRLIATLVAGQTSIFCPLFLLVGNADSCINHHQSNVDQQKHSPSSVVGFWKTTLDLFCQIILPLGLALNWFFCLSFDQKMSQLIHIYFPNTSDTASSSIWSFAWNIRCDMSLNLLEGLKLVTILVLGLEMILVCTAWVQHFVTSHNDTKHANSIQLA